MAEASFNERAHGPLADAKLRGNLRRAMDGLMDKRAAQFADPEEREGLRRLGESIRRRALARLPELLERLEAKCTENGIRVHWAETPEQANGLILGLIKAHGATLAVKGKSMVSEETHLNAALIEAGVETVESDLGEFIIQLADEAPSHIVMPCIHKNTPDIAKLFTEKIEGTPYMEDPAALTAVARRVLRERFAAAGVGLSGVNMAVAETGSLVLIENEGNGRMSTTVPPVHIAIMGIEKVVETLADVPPILSLLTRSATGQAITTYVNMISGPRRDGELDGPTEVHLVLLDNGRSRAYADPVLRRTLQCIRCGACMNHCPVYSRTGGQAYAGTYPGPIGKILEPQLHGLSTKGDLPSACSTCGACEEICPVKIPITEILVRLRQEAVGTGPGGVIEGGSRKSPLESLTWRLWVYAMTRGPLYRAMGEMATRFGGLAPAALPPLKQWTSARSKPKFATKTLHRRMAERAAGRHT